MTYNPPPNNLEAFPEARRVKPKTSVQGGGGYRKRWEDNEYIYEWDSRHGLIEKYDKRGKHLGEYDHKTGRQIKPSDPGRKTA